MLRQDKVEGRVSVSLDLNGQDAEISLEFLQIKIYLSHFFQNSLTTNPQKRHPLCTICDGCVCICPEFKTHTPRE